MAMNTGVARVSGSGCLNSDTTVLGELAIDDGLSIRAGNLIYREIYCVSTLRLSGHQHTTYLRLREPSSEMTEL